MEKYLCWDPQYAFEKIFTLTTRWQLLHLPKLTLDKRLCIPNLFIPDEIRKIRNIRSIASYEIIWKKEHSVIEMLKNYKEKNNDDDNDDDNIDDSLLTSIEPQNLVLKCYPQLVETFESIRNAKTKKRTVNSRRKKTTIDVTENNTEKKGRAKLCQIKTREKAIERENNKKIDEFFPKNRLMSLQESFEEMAITPKRSKKKIILKETNESKVKNTTENTIMNMKHIKRGPQFDRILGIEAMHSKLNNTLDRMFNELSPNDFLSENEDNDFNTTDIIEDICSKRTFELDIRSYRSAESTSQPIGGNTKVDLPEASTSNMEERIHVEDKKEKIDDTDSDDEFGDINDLYIPINQRIQSGIRCDKKLSCNKIMSTVAFENIMNETDNESMNLGT